MRLVLVVLATFLLLSAHAQPPSGLYLTLRADFIDYLAGDVGLSASNYVNGLTNLPAISGSNNQVSYQLSSFAFDIDLDNFTLTSGAPPTISAAFNSFQFVSQCNFHICAHSWPNPCDDGFVQIYTTSPAGLAASLTFDFSGPSVTLAADSASLLNAGNVQIYVQCTSTFCLIPVSDILNAIAQNFVPEFQSAVLKGLNTALGKYSGVWPTTVNLPTEHVALHLNGGFDVMGTTLVLYADGLVLPMSGTPVSPPFSPTFVPPASDLSDPPAPITAFITDYLIETAFWAVETEGTFNRTITQADIPSSVPLQLNTSNIFFAFAVPGVRTYPGLAIQINTYVQGQVTVNFNASGGSLTLPLAAEFSLVNGTALIPGWTLLLSASVPLSATAAISGTSVQITPSLGNVSCTVSLVSSALGSVSVSYFQLAVGEALKKVPVSIGAFAIPSPKDFTFTGPGFLFDTGYAAFMFDLTYNANIPDTPCGDTVCAEGNTCCAWKDGSGCCTLPNASCCVRDGCCPEGTTCAGQQCYDNNGVLYEIHKRTHGRGSTTVPFAKLAEL